MLNPQPIAIRTAQTIPCHNMGILQFVSRLRIRTMPLRILVNAFMLPSRGHPTTPTQTMQEFLLGKSLGAPMVNPIKMGQFDRMIGIFY